MEFYFPNPAFPQRHMHHPSQVRQHVFYPQYNDIEVVIVEQQPRQEYRYPLFGEGLHHQRLYQQQREQEARRYRQQQREYALEQQRLREEQAALYMLYHQKEQERIRLQEEQERIRRQQEQERLRRQQEQQKELYRRRIAEVLEERERRRQQLQQQQHAIFSFLFGQEDTDMEEPQQKSDEHPQQRPEEHPQQVAQSQMEIQQEEPKAEPEQQEAQRQESQEEISHQEDSQQESDDDVSLNIRSLFSPVARSVASDDSDDDMTSEEDQVAVHVQSQDDDMSTDEETSSESESETETEDQHIWERLSDDEKLAETKHLQLRMLGEQLEQLDEKHSSTIPSTRLQFADDNSSEITAISRENRQFLGLEDEVLQVMLQLDAVDSNGDESIRQERKSLIRKAEQLLAKMDEHKQNEWERISVSSAASATSA